MTVSLQEISEFLRLLVLRAPCVIPDTNQPLTVLQTCMQPANVVKTLLQGRGTASQLSNLSFKLLTRGAGAQFVMSLPHGAFNYATLEVC